MAATSNAINMYSVDPRHNKKTFLPNQFYIHELAKIKSDKTFSNSIDFEQNRALTLWLQSVH